MRGDILKMTNTQTTIDSKQHQKTGQRDPLIHKEYQELVKN